MVEGDVMFFGVSAAGVAACEALSEEPLGSEAPPPA